MTRAAQKASSFPALSISYCEVGYLLDHVACALAANRDVSGVSVVEAFLFIAGRLRILLHGHSSVAAPELDG